MSAWTRARVDQLRDLHAQRLTLDEIATAIGLSAGAVRGKAWRLKLRPMPPRGSKRRRYSPETVKLVRTLYAAGGTHKEIAAAADVPPISVQYLLKDVPKRSQTDDLTGRVFGRWTVLSKADSLDGARWTCRCNCGTITVYHAKRLRQMAANAGCRRCLHRAAEVSAAEKMIGARFGRLVVISRAPAGKRARWLCECDCGGQIIADGCSLRRGDYVSCGCRKRQRMAEMNRERAAQPVGS